MVMIGEVHSFVRWDFWFSFGFICLLEFVRDYVQMY